MIVDDEATVRAALVRLLRTIARIEDFASGLDAVERNKIAPFDAAVLDLRMPRLDGIGVALALRESTPSMPIVFVTGEGPGPLLTAAEAIGPVIGKPWDSVELREAVRRLLPRATP